MCAKFPRSLCRSSESHGEEGVADGGDEGNNSSKRRREKRRERSGEALTVDSVERGDDEADEEELR